MTTGILVPGLPGSWCLGSGASRRHSPAAR